MLAHKVCKTLTTIRAPNATVPDINHLLYFLRGQIISELPKGAVHFVSVGCSGKWYLNWVEELYGKVAHYIGVDYYTPRATNLPDNLTWIVNTAGSMLEFGNFVADTLFSGQNIEHRWGNDIVAFLTESHRTVKGDGLLEIDSPNRRITAKLSWNQPKHTIELEPDEIAELLNLAGFDVERKVGIWLCKIPEAALFRSSKCCPPVVSGH